MGRCLLKRGFRTEVVDGQLHKSRDVSRTDLLDEGYNKKDRLENRVPLVFDFHPALLGIGKKIRELVPILHASVDMKRILVEAPLVSFRRPKNLKGELVTSRVQRSFCEGMKRCGKRRCEICKFVKEGRSLIHNNLISLFFRSLISNVVEAA